MTQPIFMTNILYFSEYRSIQTHSPLTKGSRLSSCYVWSDCRSICNSINLFLLKLIELSKMLGISISHIQQHQHTVDTRHKKQCLKVSEQWVLNLTVLQTSRRTIENNFAIPNIYHICFPSSHSDYHMLYVTNLRLSSDPTVHQPPEQ